jgi:hypothetical protein
LRARSLPSTRPLRPLLGAGLLASLAAPAAAGPASEVASAFDEHDAFDLHVVLDYEFGMRRSTVAREASGAGVDPSAAPPSTDELEFSSARHTLTPRLELGIFSDLALTLALPVVVLDARELALSDGVDRGTSSTIADGLLPAGGFDAEDPATGLPTDAATIFRGIDRSGLDQVHLGLVWAPMNQRRDDTKPTWKLGAQLRIPIGAVARFDAADPSSETGVGEGAREVHLFTTMARRIGWAEPYFEGWWTAPIGYTGDSPFADPGFGAKSTGRAQRAGTRFGFEAIFVDGGEGQQRVSLDISARLAGQFEGRGYGELWEVFSLAGDVERGGPLVLDADPTMSGLQALSYPGVSNIENHLELGGRLALRVDLGPLVHIAALAEFGRETSHLVTFADAGVDLPMCDGGDTPGVDCEVESNEVVNPGTVEVNPLHVPLVDLVGHRYRVDGALNLRFGVQARVLF